MNLAPILLAACAAPLLAAAAKRPPDGASHEALVYVGAYTQPGGSRGIYAFRLDEASGRLTPLGLAAETSNPSFLAIHPNRRFLYAANEIADFQGKRAGAVTAFAIDRVTGKLRKLNAESSGGDGPCFVATDPRGRCVVVANYGGGSVASLPIAADGSVEPAASFIQHTGKSVDASRQEGPHAHSINIDSAGRYAYAADLGLDKILIYRFDPARCTLTPADPPFAKVAPGSGPRHLSIHPSGRFAYVISEMACTVTAFRRNPRTGALSEIQTISTLPPGEPVRKGYSTAELLVHPSGKFLYGSNRGHNSIVEFRIDQETGKLAYNGNEPSQGKTPRNFGIDPSGAWLLAANQDSGNLVVFWIDPENGRLKPTGHSANVAMPVCVRFIRP